MEVERPRYLKQLIDKKDNGRVRSLQALEDVGNHIFYLNCIENIYCLLG